MIAAVTSKFARLEKIDKHIVKAIFYAQDGKVEKEHIKETYAAALGFIEAELKYIYVVTGEFTLLSKEARAQVNMEAQVWDKQAVLIQNLAQRIMGNFIIKKNGLHDKMRLFTNEKDAFSWLSLPNTTIFNN